MKHLKINHLPLKLPLLFALMLNISACKQSNAEPINVNPHPMTLNVLKDPVVFPAPSAEVIDRATADSRFNYLAALGNAIPKENMSVVVIDVAAKKAIVNHQGTMAMNPASTLKLVTTYSAWSALGKSFNWKTLWGGEKRPDQQGVLNGPLYMKASGDPKLVIENILELQTGLLNAGVKTIAGPVVVDRSVFDVSGEPTEAFDDEPERPYNAKAQGALLNFHSVSFVFDPATQSVVMKPWLQGMTVNAKINWQEGRCKKTPRAQDYRIEHTGLSITLSGNYAKSCGLSELPLHLYQMSSDEYATRLFAAVFGGQNEGVGDLPACQTSDLAATSCRQPKIQWRQPEVIAGTIPASFKVLVTQFSNPLSSVIRDINVFSNNVMAQHVFLTLSAQKSPTGNAKSGFQNVLQILNGQGITTTGLNMENGSGLSRVNRVSSMTLAQVLSHGAQYPEFVTSLPLLGVEGTVATRFSNSDLKGRARIKTGTLSDVRAIAGYVWGNSGKQYVVASIINHPNAGGDAGLKAHNQLIEWAARQ